MAEVRLLNVDLRLLVEAAVLPEPTGGARFRGLAPGREGSFWVAEQQVPRLLLFSQSGERVQVVNYACLVSPSPASAMTGLVGAGEDTLLTWELSTRTARLLRADRGQVSVARVMNLCYAPFSCVFAHGFLFANVITGLMDDRLPASYAKKQFPLDNAMLGLSVVKHDMEGRVLSSFRYRQNIGRISTTQGFLCEGPGDAVLCVYHQWPPRAVLFKSDGRVLRRFHFPAARRQWGEVRKRAAERGLIFCLGAARIDWLGCWAVLCGRHLRDRGTIRDWTEGVQIMVLLHESGEEDIAGVPLLDDGPMWLHVASGAPGYLLVCSPTRVAQLELKGAVA